MKKKVFIPIILLAIIIALIFNTCGGESDDSYQDAPPAPQISIDKKLQQRIDSFVTKTPPIGSLGMMVYDATAKQEVYSYNADSKMSPASCMKLLTTIAAIRYLGRSAVHRNRLYTSGKMVGDTLVGNITLKVQFDPMFNRDSLYKLTEALQAKHIKRLKGNVVLDMADYDSMNHEEHWTPGDLRTPFLGLPFSGGRKLRNEMLYALARIGIPVRSENIVFGRLNYHASTQIAEITTPMRLSFEKALKNSSNVNAESILYPLGYLVSRQGHFRENGVVKLCHFVAHELKMNPLTSCTIEDGCGLCPYDKLSPKLLVTLLQYAYEHKYIYNEVYQHLPLAGTDGTLYDRMQHPRVKGKLKAKTGTLTREGGISSLAGYFTTSDGHLIIFSIINNNCPVMDGRWWQDNLLKRIM